MFEKISFLKILLHSEEIGMLTQEVHRCQTQVLAFNIRDNSDQLNNVECFIIKMTEISFTILNKHNFIVLIIIVT